MAKPKKKAKAEMSAEDLKVYSGESNTEIPASEETLIETPRGGAVGIAIRAVENNDEFRMLITIRAGYGAKDITFNFGSSGPQVRGGDPGGDPPYGCP